MAFDISRIFRPTQQVSIATPNAGATNPMQPIPVQQGGNMGVQNPGSDPNTVTPPQPGATATPQPQPGQPASPLDAFATVWQTDPKATPPADPWSQPILPSDPAKIREAASKMDMMAGVSPEIMQKAMAGNDPQSFMAVINAVAQNTLAMSAQLSSASVERAGSVIRERTVQGLPEQFRDFQLNQLPVDNPVLNHPGAQGLLQMTRQQLKMKNPDWTAQKINDQAVEYLQSFAQATNMQANPQPAQQVDPRTGQKIEDWSSFLDS